MNSCGTDFYNIFKHHINIKTVSVKSGERGTCMIGCVPDCHTQLYLLVRFVGWTNVFSMRAPYLVSARVSTCGTIITCCRYY